MENPDFWDGIRVFFLFLIKTEAGIFEMKRLGFNFVAVSLFVFLWSNFSLVVIYFFSSFLRKVMEKSIKIVVNNSNFYFRGGTDVLDWWWIKKVKEPVKRNQLKLVEWILNHNKTVLFFVLLIPFIPFLDTAAIMAAKIGQIKRAFLICFLAINIKFLVLLSLFCGRLEFPSFCW